MAQCCLCESKHSMLQTGVAAAALVGAQVLAALQASGRFCPPQEWGMHPVLRAALWHIQIQNTLPAAEHWSHLSKQVIAPVQPLVDGSCPDQRVPIEGS